MSLSRHTVVQGSEALQHLHGGRQNFLQLHLTSSLQDLGASGRVVQVGIHDSSSFPFQFHETGLVHHVVV